MTTEGTDTVGATGPPAHLHAAHQSPPLSGGAFALLVELVHAADTGAEGVHPPDDSAAAVVELRRRRLARPTARPGVVALTLSWHQWEAERMSAAAPGALDEWEPTWWPPGALADLAAIVTPAVGADLAPWFAASVAGLAHDTKQPGG